MAEFTSIKEVFNSLRFQEKLAEAKRLKKEARESYTPEAWEKTKTDLDGRSFPDHMFDPYSRPDRDNAFASHKHEGDTHSLLSYVKSVRLDWNFDLEWRYVYCPDCHKIYHRIGTVFNKVEGLSHSRWFTKSGKSSEVGGVVTTSESGSKVEATSDPYNELTAPLLDS